MKKAVVLISIFTTFLISGIVDDIKLQVKDFGKQVPIDIVIYAKNPSHKCTLEIKNISNPYKEDISNKLEPIILKEGEYYRKEIKNILKGSYEFEYKWLKDNKFIDAKVKTVRILPMHDINKKLHKRLNLTFLLSVPQPCKD